MPRNVIAPNKKEGGAALAVALSRWTYTDSVKRVTPLVMNWKNLTVELARELWFAREALNGQKGQRKDPDAEDYIPYNWSDYCEDVGLSRRTANNWLSMFIPAEHSETGEDMLLDRRRPDPDADKVAEAKEAREIRIAEYRATGTRPEGWDEGDELELRKRLFNERLHRLASDISMRHPTTIRPRRDYLAEVAANTKSLKRFRLSPDQQVLETDLRVAINSYLLTFDDPELRLKIAFNLTVSIRDIVNELTEYDAVHQAGASK